MEQSKLQLIMDRKLSVGDEFKWKSSVSSEPSNDLDV